MAMVLIPIELDRSASARGEGEEGDAGSRLPEWTALELQGELKKWKKERHHRHGQGMMQIDDEDSEEEDADRISKDPADLKLFASTFVPGLKFGLFNVDPKDNKKACIIIGHHKLEGERTELTKPLAVLRKRKERESVKYEVEGVIRFKYVFSSRPRLLISKAASERK